MRALGLAELMGVEMEVYLWEWRSGGGEGDREVGRWKEVGR